MTNQASIPDAWRDILAQASALHPMGAKAVQAAIDGGLDPASFSAIVAYSREPVEGGLPILYFGDWSGGEEYRTAQPSGVGHYVPARRGAA